MDISPQIPLISENSLKYPSLHFFFKTKEAHIPSATAGISHHPFSLSRPPSPPPLSSSSCPSPSSSLPLHPPPSPTFPHWPPRPSPFSPLLFLSLSLSHSPLLFPSTHHRGQPSPPAIPPAGQPTPTQPSPPSWRSFSFSLPSPISFSSCIIHSISSSFHHDCWHVYSDFMLH